MNKIRVAFSVETYRKESSQKGVRKKFYKEKETASMEQKAYKTSHSNGSWHQHVSKQSQLQIKEQKSGV
ncbi:hypothetical protein KFK09_016468 [Dendrobium nobile]|uniref:Uncharacterized protein n=1 Tax=Dendrobium nobile TaxID=94219 RepID=A0A8T3AYC0_DENNO|nr:hypothetical protein KFK09_016468 [Dendrobium nobile]